ncbi:alpha/beta hydrolase family protein [Microbacterium sp. CPCC 204701]|uniref:alpha/beta hydrolase family protein n=1 Tax=Microbacterium sp. CPCC 204701 TaxID=2493084 RepID=UPI000FDA676C|nr:hypothetical protein [Microbacterium sp. CPCC 204701]
MAASPELAFILDRGMLTHGCDTPLEYLRSSKPFTLEGIAADIRCPVLLATGENDPRNADAQNLFDALAAPKEYIQFENAQGAGEHDEAGAAALFSQRAFDWLDDVLRDDLRANPLTPPAPEPMVSAPSCFGIHPARKSLWNERSGAAPTQPTSAQARLRRQPTQTSGGSGVPEDGVDGERERRALTLDS